MAIPIVRLDPKLAGEVLNYGLDFRGELAGAAITGHEVTVPAGLTLVTSSASGSIVTAQLSGGTAGEDYAVLYEAQTADGQVIQAYARIQVSAAPG